MEGMTKMISKQEYLSNYWSYFCRLENQLLDVQQYVEFDKSNELTYSMEFLQISQAACNEVEVLAKIIAKELDTFGVGTYDRINQWGFVLQNAYPDLNDEKIIFYDSRILTPWKNWTYESTKTKKGNQTLKLAKKSKSPFWWVAHNKVKHERTSKYKKATNYRRANLLNTINSLAALYSLETKMQKMLKKNSLMKIRKIWKL